VGYYIDVEFDDEKIVNDKDAVQLFQREGCEIFNYPGESEEYVKKIKKQHVELVHPEITYLISVIKNKSKIKNGRWAEIRLSWGHQIFF